MKQFLPVLSFFLSMNFVTSGQQVADTAYNPPLFIPHYKIGEGPKVMIDEAHNNFHTSKGRYFPFCKVLALDGYQIVRGESSFEKKYLTGINILVIANALATENTNEWRLPNPSAFTPDEINVIQEWVSNGGSLFLIADHMPFAGAATDLAAAFGFKIYNGFAIDTLNKSGHDLFTRSEKTISDNVITNGTKNDPVDSIVTFTGQAFDIPARANSIITLDDSFIIYLCDVAWEFDKSTPRVNGKGKSQGAFMNHGKGKVVLFGEAAMFSAQVAGKKNKIGMNSEKGKNNYQLLRNIIYWLSELGE
jgi:hypothetical protein